MNAPLAGIANGANGVNNYATPVGMDRLVRDEVALGVIRAIEPPEQHIGLQLLPFLEVAEDDVVFNYLNGFSTGLTPARAFDAESDLAQADDTTAGEGRASVIDWAEKNHYDPRDLQGWREWLLMVNQLRDTNSLPLLNQSPGARFIQKVQRDTMRRSKRLYNRLEQLAMDTVFEAGVAYNDGKIAFGVDFRRPANQRTQAPTAYNDAAGGFDPIGEFLNIQQFMFDTYGVRMTRAVCSTKILNTFMNSLKFAQRSGIVIPDGNGGQQMGDLNYVLNGWGPKAALDIVSAATNIEFVPYDGTYITRAVGSTVRKVNYFADPTAIVFLPNQQDLDAYDDTDIGFGKILTSPHVEGNWQPGFYEWEKPLGPDPWGHDVGSGIKAFPVAPHMELTYRYKVLPDPTPVV